jgi:hypothetical protein
MVDQLEFSSRAVLCRKLAQREPANRVYWIAEAENWSRLSKGSPEDSAEATPGVLARLRVRSSRLMLIVA